MLNNVKVLHSDGSTEDFKARFIKEQLLRETDISEQDADKIKRSVSDKIKKIGVKEVSTSTIRAEVSAQLMQRELFEAEKDSRKLGMSVAEYEDLLQNGCKDNANIGFSPEMVSKYAYDSIAKEYALLNMPKHCADAHTSGLLHHHDLEYFNTRPNCFNIDLRFFAKNGLKVDGIGLMGSTAKPAKTLEVLLNHLLQAMMACATVFSGGIGLANFNTLLAPFAKNRSYEDIKQAIQGFVFNCNMSLICRGGQVLFSSIGVDLSIPNVLADKQAIGPQGISNGIYADYQKEADLIFKAICEVSAEKDGNGAWHRFPNILFNIREGDLDKYEGNCKILHEMGANNPTIYYSNCIDLERSTMGALSSDTPVMTDKGFKYPQMLSIGDNVMTYNEKGGKEWNKIYNIIPKPAPEKIYKITLDNNYSFKVTENHKLPTKDGIIKSEDLKVGMELYNYIDELFTPTDDYESEFIGLFLADGYIRDDNRVQTRSNAIEFHIKQKWKIDAIIDLCNKCKYNYDIVEKNDKTYSIYVREVALRDKLNSYYDSNGVKHFPSDVWYDKNIVANIIKGLMFDGRKQGKNSWVWSCSDLPLVTDVLFAISYIGRPSTLYVDNRSGKTGNWRPNYRVAFGLGFKPKNKTKIKSIELVDNKDMVYDLSIENNPNYVCGLGGIHSENCRSSLPMNYTFDYEKDCLNTGNFMYSTLNLPLIALENDCNIKKFYSHLDELCETIYDTLIYRRKCVEDVLYNKKMSTFLLQKDKETGEPLYDLNRTTMTLGFCGLKECCDFLKLDDGEEIINFINEKKEEFFKRDGLRWSVIASPAESTAHRFAEIIKSKYPDAPLLGKKDHYYLTNSSHIPVTDEENIIKHIENANKYHPKTLGGNILHLWIKEVWSDPKSYWELNKKILEGGTIFWAYSKVFTYCNECGFTLNDKIEKCPICESKDLVTYDRCFAGDTFIYIKKDKIIKPVTLKDFVENYHVTDWQVPVFDYKTQSYIWSKVKRGIKNPPEPMINIHFNKGYKVTCTPNHNFYDYKTHNRKNSMYGTIVANDLSIKSRIMNHRCPIFLDNIEEDYLGTFIGFVLGDGNITLQKNGKNIFIRLKFYKKEKSDYCKEILDKNNLEYTFSDVGIDERYNSQTYSYYIGANNIGNKAYDIFNMTRGDKRAVIDMCYNQDLFVGIFAGLINSNGSVLVKSIKNDIVTTFNQVDRDILWLFYNIALLLGTNPSISFTQRDGYDSIGRIEITSLRAYDILNNIILRSPFDEALVKGKCISDAKSVNGMCSVSSISESIVQNSYCIETEHDGHNTLFNGVLAQNCTGYYLPTNGFNNGKQQEFQDRFRHNL